MFDFMFYFSAGIVLPFWFVMIVIPHTKLAERMVKSPWIILPPVICYLYFLLPNLGVALAEFHNITPESLARMMGETWAASLFWAYAGAFDLFVGRWIYFDAKKRKITHWFVSPILFVTIFFGPLGFSMYAVVKGFYGGLANVGEENNAGADFKG